MRKKSDAIRIRIISVLTILALLGGYVAYDRNYVSADEQSPFVIDKSVDAPSDYGDHMSEPNDTSEIGRIKTDKTVRKVGFTSVNREDGAVNGETDIGDNFTVTFSALSSGGTIAGSNSVPVDVVLVLDFSSSMTQSAGTKSRAGAMVDAVNAAIGELMRINPQNRVAAVAFSSNATTVFPLQSITPLSGDNYLSISSSSTSTTYSNVRVTPNSSVITGGSTVSLNRGTNIQAGLYSGMNMLTVSDPTVVIGGETYNRAPGVILMTDGGPSSVYRDSSWWSPSTSAGVTTTQGVTQTGVSEVAKYFAPILEASYMKNKIADHYDTSCYVYSVGLGIQNTSGNPEKAAAYVVLNPSEYVDADGTINLGSASYASGIDSSAKAAFKTAYTDLLQNKTAVSLRCRESSSSTRTITFNYPSSEADAKYMPTNFKYNDGFTESTDTDELINAFIGAISTIADKGYFPTDVEDITGETSGYITFTDIVGDLMEVKEFKSILWVDHKPGSSTYGQDIEYTNVEKTTSGNIDRYVFDDATHSSWLFNYEDTNLNKIIIEVDHSGTNDVVTIKIPPALVPMVNYTVKKQDGVVSEEVTRNEMTRPIKINYIVGPKEGVVNYIAGVSTALDGDADLKAQADAYIANPANTVELAGGKSGVALYTNSWNGSDETVVPVAEFSINALNDYYSFAKNTLLYTDANCTTPATSFTAGTTYYYKNDVYIVGETGADADREDHIAVSSLSSSDVVVDGGEVYVKAGVHKTLPADTAKSPNVTDTKPYQLRSHWWNGTTLHQHQGNNGRLVIERPGELKIDKTITTDDGVTGIDYDILNSKKFEFEITLTSASGITLTGEYDYVISNPSVDEADWVSGKIQSGDSLKITEDETILITGLPNGARYTVEEINIPGGYTLTKINDTAVSGTTSSSGEIVSGETSSEVFENNYSFEGNEYTLGNRPYVKKSFSGRNLLATDNFTFTLLPYASNTAGATILTDTVELSQSSGSVDTSDPNATVIHGHFGGIEFSQPGEYWFRISETAGSIPGITYSQSVYAYVVTVHDNGDGTLLIDPATDIKMMKTIDMDGSSVPEGEEIVPETSIPDGSGGTVQGHEANFTNKYEADAVTIGTVGEKQFVDTTGTKPMTANMFTFELRPSFYDAAGDPLSQEAVDAVPMPDGSVPGGTDADTGLTYNQKDTFNSASGDFGFGTITFDGTDIGNAYRYVVQEIIPDAALSGGTRHYVNRNNESDTIDTTDDHGYLWHNGTEIYDLKTITHEGFVYDCSRHVVVVEVTQDAEGHIIADVQFQTYDSQQAEKVEIKNRYEPASAVTDGDVLFNKEMRGRDMNAGESFTFTFVPSGANAIAGVQNGWVVLPGGGNSISFTVDGLSKDESKNVPIDGIEFKRPGSYTFSITEAAGSAPGMTYDSHTLSIIITVEDINGTLEITNVRYNGNQTFTNTYSADSVDYGSAGALQIEKRVDGRSMVADSFGFVVVAEDDNARAKTPNNIPAAASGYTEDAAIYVRNKSNAAPGVEAGTQALTDFSFTLEDAGKTFTYKVAEVIPSGATDPDGDGKYTYEGVTYAYDGLREQTVAFAVVDNGDGTLSVTATNAETGESVESKSGTQGTIEPLEVHFANEFNYEPLVYASPVYTKRIAGRDWQDGESFTFNLTAWDGAPLPQKEGSDNTEETVGFNDQSGNSASFSFGEATFTRPGTYTYTIKEEIPDNAVNEEGVSYGSAGEGDSGPWSLNGLTYDEGNRAIQVIVTDKGDGTLTARATATEGSRVFTNTYSAYLDFTEEELGMLGVSKTLTGRSIRDREFMIDVRPYSVMDGEQVREGYASAEETAERFEMRSSEVLPVLKPSGTGTTYTTLAIPGIRMTSDDIGTTYAFEIREYIPADATNEDDVRYDDATDTDRGPWFYDGVEYNTNGVDRYLVEIKAEDNDNGTLKVTVTLTPYDEAGQVITSGIKEVVYDGAVDQDTAIAPFENSYNAGGETIINAIKDLEGRAWTTDDAYRFKIERMKLDEGTGQLVELASGETLNTPLPNYELTAIIEAEAVGSDGSQHHAVRNPEDKATPENLKSGWQISVKEEHLTKEYTSGIEYGDFYYKITEIVPNDATAEIEREGEMRTVRYEDATAEERAANRFELNGVEYSHTPRFVHVHAQDTRSGGITTDVNYVTRTAPNVDLGYTPVFTNYSDVATETVELKATKQLNRNFLSTDEDLGFVITASTGTPMPENITVKRTSADFDVTSNKDTFSFGSVTYSATDLKGATTKIFTYTVMETAGNQSDITYDESAVQIYVRVTDNKDGTLKVELSDTGEDTDFEDAADFTAWPVISNEYTSPTRVFTVVKKWNDENNRDGIRPDAVEVTLYQGEGAEKVEIETKELKESNNWHHTFTGLQRYKADGKTEYVYSVEETEVTGYVTAYSEGTGLVNDPLVITNTHAAGTETVSATKVWAGDNDDALGLRRDVKLHLVGKVSGSTVYFSDSRVIELTGEQTVSWPNVPVYYQGSEIEYTVVEEAIFGYSTAVTGNVDAGFTVTNTLSVQADTITATKEWRDGNNQDGIRPSSVTFQLYQKVGSEGETAYGEPVTVGENENWTHTWDNLPFVVEREVGGVLVEEAALYIVDEVMDSMPDGYTKQVFAGGEGEFTIVNTHIPETIDISATKVWVDDDNAAGNRPGYVTLHLMAKVGDELQEQQEAQVAIGDDWTVTWHGLPKYRNGGEEIEYTVTEDAVSNYVGSDAVEDTAGHFVVTNTFGSNMTIKVKKTWQDTAGNELDTAPETVTLHLMKRIQGYAGTEVAVQEIPEGTASTDFTLDFGTHPTVENGQEVTYYVVEDSSETFEATYGDGEIDGTVLTLPVTNKQVNPEPISGKIYISFVDGLNRAGNQVLKFMEIDEAQAEDPSSLMPANPDHSAEGATFQQWDRNESATDDDTHLITYVARYQYPAPDTRVTVSYVDGQAEGSNLVKSERTNSPSSVTPPAAPSHDGYNFTGWSETIDAAGNHIFVAKFEKVCPDDCGNKDVDPPDGGNTPPGGGSDDSGSGKAADTGDEATPISHLAALIILLLLLATAIAARHRRAK